MFTESPIEDAMSDSVAVSVSGLRHHYGDREALCGIQIKLPVRIEGRDHCAHHQAKVAWPRNLRFGGAHREVR